MGMTEEKGTNSPDKGVTLVTWALPDHGTKSVAFALAGTLSEEPHHLTIVEANLPEALTGQSLLQTLASWSGMRIETTAVALRGWPVVEEALGGREVRVVVAMDPVVAGAVDTWRGKGHLHAPLVGVISGLRVDPAWAKTSVDRLSVADEHQAEQALELGLPAECVVPCGIPVCGGFSSVSPDEKQELRRRFDLPEQAPVVLVVTEGLDHDELTGALFQLSMVGDRASLLFDVARDDESASLLRRRASLYGVQARMFGKVEQAGQLWAAADVVVSRSHLYVEQRVVALRLPLIHLLPDGETGRETARIYVERGIGRSVTHLATLAAEVELQLQPDVLQRCRQVIGEISRRSACREVARMVAQVWAEAPRILEERYRRSRHEGAEQGPDEAQDKTPPAKESPLEVIGVASLSEGSAGIGFELSSMEDLEAAEIVANQQVTEHHQEVERWSHRADLARNKGDLELQREAEQQQARARDAMHKALAELARLAEKRKTAEAEAHGRLERTFRKMEVEDALDALKRKIEREGDG